MGGQAAGRHLTGARLSVSQLDPRLVTDTEKPEWSILVGTHSNHQPGTASEMRKPVEVDLGGQFKIALGRGGIPGIALPVVQKLGGGADQADFLSVEAHGGRRAVNSNVFEDPFLRGNPGDPVVGKQGERGLGGIRQRQKLLNIPLQVG